MTEGFTEKFAAGLASYGDQPCIEFEGRWYSGDEVTAYGTAIASVLREAGVGDDAPVGLVVRNRLQHAAAIIDFLAAGRPVSMIYSFQSPEAIGRDIEELELSAIIADREDWTEPVIDAAKRTGSAGVAISLTAPTVAAVPGLERRDESRRHTETESDVALQILTSGTTGPPKRQAIKTAVLERTVFSVTSGEKAPPGAPPEFAYWQFGGIGVCQLVAGAYNARRIVMLERFTDRRLGQRGEDARHQALGRAARGHPHAARCRRAQGGPGLAGIPDQRVGSARPGDPRRVRGALRIFPVKLAYGATEFAGSLCAWTPDMDRRVRYGQAQQRRSRATGYPTAHRRPGHRRRAAGRRTGIVGSQDHLDQRRLDPHHRHRLDRRGRVRHAARQGRRRDQSWRDSRSCRKPFGAC